MDGAEEMILTIVPVSFNVMIDPSGDYMRINIQQGIASKHP